MDISKEYVADDIILTVFDNQDEITRTFVRFQEYYESPRFRGEIFSLDEFKEWYRAEKGEFSYFEDWNGFNIPSHVLKPFMDGRFDPLRGREERFLSLFEEDEDPFYIVGIHEGMDDVGDLLEHEIAHGFFYTDGRYRETVREVLEGYDVSHVKEELRGMAGYSEEVLEDEVHAYASVNPDRLECKIQEGLQEALRENLQDWMEEKGVSVQEFV